MRIDPAPRRVRHDVADGLCVMALSAAISVVLATVVAIGLAQL